MSSEELYEEAVKLISKSEISNRHTFFQLKHFVLGKELTTQAKMQKCLKETEARVESMNNIILSVDETNDDIKLLELKILSLEKKKPKNDINKEYKQIQIRKLQRKKSSLFNSLHNLRKKLKETEEEMAFFISAFKQLEKIEPLKKYDDLESNQNFWNENFGQELQLRLLLQKPIDLELVKCILALDKDSPIRKEVVNMLEQLQNKAIENKKTIEQKG
jgi:hypothetical protein